jgi:putative transposase
MKYEQVSLHAYDSVAEARASIMQYLDWYTDPGPRLSLGRETPDETYAVLLPTLKWQRENQRRFHL